MLYLILVLYLFCFVVKYFMPILLYFISMFSSICFAVVFFGRFGIVQAWIDVI